VKPLLRHPRPPLAAPVLLCALAAACGPKTTGPAPSMAQAVEYIASEDCASAEPMLQRLLDEHLADPANLHHYLGVCRQSAGDLAGAELHYREALQRNPGLFESRNNLGVVLGEAGRHEESLAVLTELTQAFPEEPSGYYNLGFEQAESGELEGALASFRKSAELDTCGTEALLQASVVLEALGRPDDVIATLQEARQRAPQDGTVAVSLSRAFAAAGRPDEAVGVLDEVASSGTTDARVLSAVAFELRDLGRIDDGLAAARAGIDRATDDEGCRVATLAFAVIARQHDRRDDAEAVLRAGMARLPDEPDLAFFLGGLLAEQGGCVEAIPLLKRAQDAYAAEDPQSPRAREAGNALAACGAGSAAP